MGCALKLSDDMTLECPMVISQSPVTAIAQRKVPCRSWPVSQPPLSRASQTRALARPGSVGAHLLRRVTRSGRR